MNPRRGHGLPLRCQASLRRLWHATVHAMDPSARLSSRALHLPTTLDTNNRNGLIPGPPQNACNQRVSSLTAPPGPFKTVSSDKRRFTFSGKSQCLVSERVYSPDRSPAPRAQTARSPRQHVELRRAPTGPCEQDKGVARRRDTLRIATCPIQPTDSPRSGRLTRRSAGRAYGFRAAAGM